MLSVVSMLDLWALTTLEMTHMLFLVSRVGMVGDRVTTVLVITPVVTMGQALRTLPVRLFSPTLQ